jgi:hypothetical protein
MHGLELRPRDRKRHAVTQAFWAGTPLEIGSKMILCYANLSTTLDFRLRFVGKKPPNFGPFLGLPLIIPSS